MPIRKLLIANRGEIARRIIRTARGMGIQTVAVYSDADSGAPFVREADEAVRIGPPSPAESYLSGPALIDAAKRTGADALHPGYGFLSENGAFARSVIEAGVTWVGPGPDAIDAMGSKAEAKALMEASGVPTVPGYSGDDQSVERLEKEAKALGYPILLKASAGGGGKGMRVVRSDEHLTASIQAAQREGKAAFGDPQLIIERYVEKPRHIEFQILGDGHGNLIHLFDRECSIQRRHQKILEEAPSPGLDASLRTTMADAAVAAGKALSYTSAGTVEFILGPDGSFYFLEVNTRLQVEHPVTELTTGLDLVELQLLVAEGHRLPIDQEDVALTGHAIEARLYAEDPANDFLPCTGTLLDWHIPVTTGVRVDSGVMTGGEVSVHYDPMLAKVIAYGATREAATRRLHTTLERSSLLGVVTNREFLCDVLATTAWADAELHTHFIEEHSDELQVSPDLTRIREAAAVASCHHILRVQSERTLLPGLAYGWRNNRSRSERYGWVSDATEAPINVLIGADTDLSWTVDVDGRACTLEVIQHTPDVLMVALDGIARHYRVRTTATGVWIHNGTQTVTLSAAPVFPEAGADDDTGGCLAPMPGKVLAIHVAPGDTVDEGDTLVVLEAMKMEHSLTAAKAGQVAELLVAVGEQVEGGAPLVVMAEGDAS
ncbi:MAG: biotin carboxylase N-terminal domain-containing protein [Myxococcota bacterium]